jgi:hypothetical protein
VGSASADPLVECALRNFEASQSKSIITRARHIRRRLREFELQRPSRTTRSSILTLVDLTIFHVSTFCFGWFPHADGDSALSSLSVKLRPIALVSKGQNLFYSVLKVVQFFLPGNDITRGYTQTNVEINETGNSKRVFSLSTRSSLFGRSRLRFDTR